jgi:hypothetical protein
MLAPTPTRLNTDIADNIRTIRESAASAFFFRSCLAKNVMISDPTKVIPNRNTVYFHSSPPTTSS